MRRLPRLLRLLVMVLLVIEAAYLVGANAALLFVPGIVNRTPDRMLVHFQAFSPFPGWVLVRDFSMRAQDRFVQWQLDIGRASLWLDLRSLKDAAFHVRRVGASGVSFRLRRKLLASEATPELVLAQPRIEGYGTVGLRHDRAFPMPPARPHSWTVRMDRVNARAHEVWMDTLRYQGPLTAKGAWSLHLDKEAWIGPAQVELEGGDLSRGALSLGQDVYGRLEGQIETFHTRKVPGAKILDYIDAKADLSGALRDVSGAARALGASDALAITGSPGRLALQGRLNKGLLEPGTKLSAEIPRASLKLAELAAGGSARASAEVQQSGKIALDVNGERMSLRDPANGQEFVRNAAVHLSTWVPSNDVRAFKPPTRAELELKRSEIPKLSVLNRIIPEPVGVDVRSGRGSVDAKLDVKLDEGVGSGRVNVHLRDVALRQKGDEVMGDVDVALRVGGVRPDLRRATLSGSNVSIRDMKVRSGRSAKPWGGEIKIPEGSLHLDRKELFRGQVVVNFEDARPFFRAMLERAKVPGIARRLFTPNDVRGRAELGFGRGWVRVDKLNARVGRTRVTGVARLGKDTKEGAARLSLGVLSVGLELRDGNRHFKVLPSRAWFARQTARVAGPQGG